MRSYLNKLLWIVPLCLISACAIFDFSFTTSQVQEIRVWTDSMVVGAMICCTLFAMFLYALVVYKYSYRICYLYRGLYLLSICILSFISFGLLGNLAPFTLLIKSESILACSILACVFASKFTLTHFQVISPQSYAKKIIFLNKVLLLCLIILFFYKEINNFIYLIVFLEILLIVHAAFNIYEKKEFLGFSFLWIWLVISAAFFVYLLNVFSLIDFASSGKYLFATVIIEAFVTSYGMAGKFSTTYNQLSITYDETIAAIHRAKVLKSSAENLSNPPVQVLEKIQQRIIELEMSLVELDETNKLLKVQTNTDPLTSVKNRKFFDDSIILEFKKSLKTNNTLSLLMIDIDHFKNINDSYGHPAGDKCLKQVATCIQNALRRSTDICSRYGGEEFAVILPSAPKHEAMRIANDILLAVRETSIYIDPKTSIKLTISIGFCCLVDGKCSAVDELIHAADQALYTAKTNGRNQISYLPLN